MKIRNDVLNSNLTKAMESSYINNFNVILIVLKNAASNFAFKVAVQHFN